MESWWFKHAAWMSIGTLVGMFAVIGLWESKRTRRPGLFPKEKRWLLHGALAFINDTTESFVLRTTAIAVAFAVNGSPYGILNRDFLPFGVRFLLTFFAVDLFQYFSHYLRHRIPLFWRFHSVHHADREVDLSTGIRFHPGEILISHGLELAFIAALAPPPLALFCYELCNIAETFFSHANTTLPPGVERILRLFLVTPEFHRIHHSVEADEQQSNYSVMFSIWDRMFHTAREHPRAGEAGLQVGICEVSAEQSLNPLRLVALPFVLGSTQTPQTSASAASTGEMLPHSTDRV